MKLLNIKYKFINDCFVGLLLTLLLISNTDSLAKNKKEAYLTVENSALSDIYIAYSAYWTIPHNSQWFSPLLLWHKDEEIVKDSTFYSVFLFYRTSVLENSVEYRLYQRSEDDTPAFKRHWDKYLTIIFDDTTELGGLNAAVKKIKMNKFLSSEYRAEVIIGIPYPDPRQENFNPDCEILLNFNDDQDRLKALQIFLDSLKKEWLKKSFNNLKLIGFYWIQEANFSDYPVKVERGFLKKVSNLVHSFRLSPEDSQYYNFLIIPSLPNVVGLRIYRKPGFSISDYRFSGFDAVIIQPGILYGNLQKRIVQKYSNLAFTAEKAQKENFGISIELSPTPNNDDKEMLRAFYAHLDAGYKFGYMDRYVVKTYWFQPYSGNDPDGNAYHGLPSLFYQRVPNLDPKTQRKIYDDTYKFVRGRYKPSDSGLEREEIEKYIYPNR